MKSLRFICSISPLFVLPWLFVSCGAKTPSDAAEAAHDHAHDSSKGHDVKDRHDHDHDAFTGARFTPDRGIELAPETRQSLGLETITATTRSIPNQIRFTVQIFGENHRHLPGQIDHSGCDAHGSGFVATNTAAGVAPGQPVDLLKGTNLPLRGVVLTVQKALALGETEIVVGASNAATVFKSGEFVPARLIQPRAVEVVAIPPSAVLRTAEGSFVYAVRGDAFRRTPLQTGAEMDGWIEVSDGLKAGDQVVTQAVQSLWLIELRATKGGGHAH